MTLSELQKKGESVLREAGVENYSNEARWLLESAFGINSSAILLNGSSPADVDKAENFLSMVRERAGGRPLQYILGRWDFYGREFAVGEGVLIPRPETEMLVDCALEYLRGRNNPTVIDLCAGSGCVGLTVAAEIPDSEVYLVEKYDEAFEYLKRNKELLGVNNAVLIKADVLDSGLVLPKADMILSNPPYIRSGEIPSLQAEVLREPLTALDAGEDGLVFYRAIAKLIRKYCSGAAAVECGENQAEDVAAILGNAHSLRDFNSIDRIVVTEGENDAF
ncbi:MAG: peptide chain release factor N(5)-glutamine methyltransferase [Clostridia bacterium]|nr:peptide chain release factor N(5)-glutamine methyltransferase [Clostridia bacterium]